MRASISGGHVVETNAGAADKQLYFLTFQTNLTPELFGSPHFLMLSKMEGASGGSSASPQRTSSQALGRLAYPDGHRAQLAEGRYDLLGKEAHALLRNVNRHAAVLEEEHNLIRAKGFGKLRHPLDDLLRGAPGMGVIEAVEEGGSIFPQRRLHDAVGLIPLNVAQMAAEQFVMTQGGMGVLDHVLLGAFLGLGRGLRGVGPQRKLCLGRGVAGRAVQLGVLLSGLEREPQAGGRDNQRPDVILRDDRDAIVRPARAPEIGAQVPVGLRPKVESFDLVMFPVEVTRTGGEELLENLQRLVEAPARLRLVDAEPCVLPAAEAAPDAAGKFPIGA